LTTYTEVVILLITKEVGMGNFSKVRLRAAKIIRTIVKKFPETAEAMAAESVLSELDYEGGEDYLVECLHIADELEDVYDLNEALHDVICNIFYDLRLNEKEGSWAAYWSHAMSVLEKK
jgi:hypothetical protein